jgi:XTP/dITP diphosphohydrolase
VTRKLLLATRSAGKLRELEPLFAEAGFEAITLKQAGIEESPDEDAVEAYDTFEENALAKARYFRRLSRMPVFADDSGLVVPALGGDPGVLSKRWSGRPDLSGQALDDENNCLLLERLRGVSDRRAHYVCAAAFVGSGRETVSRAEVHGQIVDSPRGTGGFGYDPYFVADELGRTFGEATTQEKQAISHRARAFRALLAALADA